ncbi:MAG: hypothetical protein N2589_00750 [bacterium]|nr:hypothetical protein [bacterium]
MKKIILTFLMFSILLYTHKINVFTYQEGNKIFVEGYFPDGKPVKNSKIEIYNEKEERILEGKTDESGIFSFNIPESEKIKIILTSDEGHRTETFMELKKEKKLKSERVEEKLDKFKEIKEKEEKIEIDKEEIKRIVEDTIEKKINDFIREYKKEREKEKVQDIIGGIGYIIGILGIYFYFLGKKNVR